MAANISISPHSDSFEYELFEEDPDHFKTVVSTPNQPSLWIDPGALKLAHRIGRGPFGDVWIATLHQFTEDYDEYHEVSVKMLNLIKEDRLKDFMAKFEDVFSNCQGLQGVCLLHGISVKNGKICIIMKFYEGSVGDKMAHFKGDKLPLPDILRYGIDLAQAILEMHSRGILVLNLKPFNFLLTEQDQAILGDFGIPSLFLGIPLPNSDMTLRLGTPNYMAPEQWEPDVRGPISVETDLWGFGCSIVEMLSGVRPWSGRSAKEIYHLVVTKQERPNIPSGLPPAVENVINGCFEYDFRSRPLVSDILQAFKSSFDSVYNDSGWISTGNRASEKSSSGSNNRWLLSKDQLEVGDTVRSRKPANSCKPENMDVPEGMVVGLELDGDRGDSYVLVRVHGIHDPLRIHSSTLERLTFGFAAGDWVCVREEERKHSPVGILHSIERDGRVSVGFIGMKRLWRGDFSELQMAESYCVGQFVRVKGNVLSPRFDWPRKRCGAWETGRIWRVLPNGCLVVRFPGRLVIGDAWHCSLADPAEVEVVSFGRCVGVVNKYQHLEDFHWSVRPLVIALGLLTALKLGLFIGKNVGRSRRRRGKGGGGGGSSGGYVQSDGQQQDGQNPAWLPPSVANILFREGAHAAAR